VPTPSPDVALTLTRCLSRCASSGGFKAKCCDLCLQCLRMHVLRRSSKVEDITAANDDAMKELPTVTQGGRGAAVADVTGRGRRAYDPHSPLALQLEHMIEQLRRPAETACLFAPTSLRGAHATAAPGGPLSAPQNLKWPRLLRALKHGHHQHDQSAVRKGPLPHRRRQPTGMLGLRIGGHVRQVRQAVQSRYAATASCLGRVACGGDACGGMAQAELVACLYSRGLGGLSCVGDLIRRRGRCTRCELGTCAR